MPRRLRDADPARRRRFSPFRRLTGAQSPLDDANEWGIALLDSALRVFGLADPDALALPWHADELEALGDAAHGFALALSDPEVAECYRTNPDDRRQFRENIEWVIGALATLSGCRAGREITILRETVHRINGFGFESLDPVLISQRREGDDIVHTVVVHASTPGTPAYTTAHTPAFA